MVCSNKYICDVYTTGNWDDDCGENLNTAAGADDHIGGHKNDVRHDGDHHGCVRHGGAYHDCVHHAFGRGVPPEADETEEVQDCVDVVMAAVGAATFVDDFGVLYFDRERCVV